MGKVKSFPQDEIKVLTLRQGNRESRSEDTPTNWDREEGGIGIQSVQLGRGWDRESSDTNHHQGELRDGSQSMDREVKGPEDSGTKQNGDDGSERKELTDEEKQIHKGLDYLQSRNSVSDKVIVKESVSNMAATGKSVHAVRNDSEKHEFKEKTEFSRVDSKNVLKMPTRIGQKPGHLVKRSSILKSFIRQKPVSGSNIPSKSQNGSHSTSFTSKKNLMLRRKKSKKRFPVDTGSQVEPEKPKTVLLHDTGKLLNVLANGGRGRNNSRGYEISPNQVF